MTENQNENEDQMEDIEDEIDEAVDESYEKTELIMSQFLAVPTCRLCMPNRSSRAIT